MKYKQNDLSLILDNILTHNSFLEQKKYEIWSVLSKRVTITTCVFRILSAFGMNYQYIGILIYSFSSCLHQMLPVNIELHENYFENWNAFSYLVVCRIYSSFDMIHRKLLRNWNLCFQLFRLAKTADKLIFIKQYYRYNIFYQQSSSFMR